MSYEDVVGYRRAHASYRLVTFFWKPPQRDTQGTALCVLTGPPFNKCMNAHHHQGASRLPPPFRAHDTFLSTLGPSHCLPRGSNHRQNGRREESALCGLEQWQQPQANPVPQACRGGHRRARMAQETPHRGQDGSHKMAHEGRGRSTYLEVSRGRRCLQGVAPDRRRQVLLGSSHGQ